MQKNVGLKKLPLTSKTVVCHVHDSLITCQSLNLTQVYRGFIRSVSVFNGLATKCISVIPGNG